MTFNILNNFDITAFQDDLIHWYESNRRNLPWRKDQDPYKIWVSEIMLQQTRVDTVIPYFHRFLDHFPTLEALAAADEEEVLKVWEGLGYYSRARNLQAGVREVCEKYHAAVPDNKKDISSLKGVGPYTAGAILSIAYGQAEPAVDGNVMRVISRNLLIKEDISKSKTRGQFEDIIQKMIPTDRTSSFNQALMELGAMVCTPKSPRCLLCPVKAHCHAYEQGVQEELPVKTKKRPPKSVPMAVAVLENEQGRVLIHRRPQKGLLAGLWEFPGFEVVAGKNKKTQLLNELSSSYQIKANLNKRLPNIQHVFTHLKWELAVYQGTIQGLNEPEENLKLVTFDDLSSFPFPVPHQKIIHFLKNHEE